MFHLSLENAKEKLLLFESAKILNVNNKTRVCSLHFDANAYIPESENKDKFGSSLVCSMDRSS